MNTSQEPNIIVSGTGEVNELGLAQIARRTILHGSGCASEQARRAATAGNGLP
jgi:hypothetical protein